MPESALRIDRLLWFLRFAASRSFAQSWVAAGHVRVSGQRVTKTAHPVRVGDVLTLPMRAPAAYAPEVHAPEVHAPEVHPNVCVIEILALPTRRGPSAEAAACYRYLAAHRVESDSQHKPLTAAHLAT